MLPYTALVPKSVDDLDDFGQFESVEQHSGVCT